MKITAFLAAGILAACQSIASAAVLVDFDSQADYTSHFYTASGSLSYSATDGGLKNTASTASIGIYANDTGNPYATTFLNEDLSLTFQQTAFTTNPSMGLVARASSASSGIAGLVYLKSGTSVRLALGSGVLASLNGGFFYDATFTGLSFATSDTFTLTLEQRNASVGSDLFAEFQITLLDVSTGDTLATSDWKRFTTANSYTAAGAAGIRAYNDKPAMRDQIIHSFAVIPEPSTLALLGVVGIALAGWGARRKSGLPRRV